MKYSHRAMCTLTGVAIAVLGSMAAAPAHAKSRVYRCGSEYTNSSARVEMGGCVPLTTGNLTVVRSSKLRASMRGNTATSSRRHSSSSRKRRTSSARSASRKPVVVSSRTQRARDAGARGILQTELNRAQKRLIELRGEYKNGQPDKQGPEVRNHQKYLDRVARLKADISRTESDIKGIRREIGRTGS